MTLMGRLVLGGYVNLPRLFFRLIFFNVPAWWHWYRTFLNEIYLHIGDRVEEKKHTYWHVTVPGYHFVVVYEAARLLQLMESIDNRSRSVSLVTVVVLSFFPPLCAVYLQRIMNHHWSQHVYKYCDKHATFRHKRKKTPHQEPVHSQYGL